ncbi:MAG: DUF2232 domain-containing protein [Syntrophomonadaceae bacterium]|nr:DUF2232 domain-containing protein [Syntrophomonadaceae bacterium]
MEIFFFLMVSTIICFLMSYISGLTVLFAILWGTCLIISSLYLDKPKLVLVFTVNLGTLYLLTEINSLFFYVSFFGLAALVMCLLIIKNKDYYYLQKWGLITAVAGVSVFLCVIFLSTGDIGIKELEEQLVAYTSEVIQVYEENGILEIYQQQGILKDDLEKSMYGLASSVAKHLPALYYLQAILAVFFMLLFASWVSLKRNLERLKKRPYIEEIMPWQLVWVVIAGLFLWLVGRNEMSLIFYAGSNILLIMAPIAVYFGLGALLFRIKQNSPNKGKRLTILLVVIAVLFPLSAIIFLGILGLFDALLDFRKLRIEE